MCATINKTYTEKEIGFIMPTDFKILITGGTGSLGRALVKKIKKLGWQIVIYSRDEGKQAAYFGSDKSIKCVIGNVRDLNKLDTTFRIHKPDFVIHTAALKRIEDMEFYPDECVKTNILGSENVAVASLKNGVKKCILVSTDKACQPVNVYGSSKFIAERIFTNYDFNSTDTVFASVRYGNVIASRGSFIPLWMAAIEKGQTINVTSSEMTRFLFTLDDAVDTVLCTLETAVGGEVFIPRIDSYTLPRCIEAVSKILAKEIKVNMVGIRPGEKLHEDMLAKTELPFTFIVGGNNLLQVRPQYTSRVHQNFEKYEGPEFNSSLWVEKDVDKLVELIKKGLECS